MNLKTYIRESVTFTIPLNDRGVAFAPGEDYNLIFTAKRSEKDADLDALFQKASGAGITLDNTSALVSLVPDDTTDLEAGNIVYDIRAQHVVTGARKTVARGVLKLIQDVGREPETSVPVITIEPPLPFSTTAQSINAAVEKGTPANADRVPATDSEDGYKLVWFSWQTIKNIFFGDATTKADAAQAAAALDATTKANAAEAAAIAAAALDATDKANNAEANAIYAAALDATDKANNAEAYAIAVAALDATDKANNAEANAIAAAALDATDKANAAQAAAEATAAADPRHTDSREWTAATVDQAEAEAGSATTRRAWTALRVRQAIVGWVTGLSAKTTPVDADGVVLRNSAASNAPVFVSLTNLWTNWLKPILDGTLTIAGAKTWSGLQRATGQNAVPVTSDEVLVRAGLSDVFETLKTRRIVYFPANPFTFLSTGTGGRWSGAQTTPNAVTYITGTTAGSISSGYSGGNIAPVNTAGVAGDSPGVINFSRRNTVYWKVSFANVAANMTARAFWGGLFNPSAAQASSDPTSKSVGFRVDGTDLKLVVHDGTTLNVSASLLTITSSIIYEFILISDGNGNASLYNGSTFLGSLTGAPTGNTSPPTHYPVFIDAVSNGAASTDFRFGIYDRAVITGTIY